MQDSFIFEDALMFARRQVRRLIEQDPGFYPMYTSGGRWRHDLPAWTRWCDGFLPGMMWIFHSHAEPDSEEARFWRTRAVRYSEPLEPRQFDRDVHDLGFLFLSTYHRWWKATGDARLRDVLIQAGRTMALRFRERGEYLRSFIAEDSLFIDIMMNVGIVFYAARETGDAALRDIALRHSLTTRRVLVRGDGSTAHEGLFDLNTGEFRRQTTHQGFRGDSCWSRGLAWAIYGFGAAFHHTGDTRFLATAESCAEFYLENVPDGGVPPWDFDAPPETRAIVDTSAAAIAAAGLLRLARMTVGPARRRHYHTAALHTLATLCREHLANDDPKWEGILKHGVYHLHQGLGVGESVMWGEYFFVEALARALDRPEPQGA